MSSKGYENRNTNGKPISAMIDEPDHYSLDLKQWEAYLKEVERYGMTGPIEYAKETIARIKKRKKT